KTLDVRGREPALRELEAIDDVDGPAGGRGGVARELARTERLGLVSGQFSHGEPRRGNDVPAHLIDERALELEIYGARLAFCRVWLGGVFILVGGLERLGQLLPDPPQWKTDGGIDERRGSAGGPRHLQANLERLSEIRRVGVAPALELFRAVFRLD